MSLDLNSVKKALDSATKGVKDSLSGLIDDGSFVELDAFITGSSPLGEPTGEGVISGFASVNDKDVAVFAMNPEVFGGGLSLVGAKKIERIVSRAIESGKPLVALLDTCGARVLEGVDVLAGFDRVLSAFAVANGQIPVITVVKGKCFGSLTYLAGLSDAFIAYEKAEIATSSPVLLGADAGAKVHFEKSGIVTNIVKDDAECKELVSKYLEVLNDVQSDIADDPNRVCKGLSAASETDAVIKEAFDQGSLIEVRGGIAKEAKTFYACLDGVYVAAVGVDGRLSSKGAAKITDFITSAGEMGLPVITLVNSDGIICDAHQESHCLVRNVSDLIYAYTNISTAKLSVITGKAVGAAYSVLASKANSSFVFAFEGAYIAPVESAAAARMLEGEAIAKAEDQDAAEKKFAEIYENDNSAIVAARAGYVDSVIVPDHIRQYLIASLRNA